MSKGLKIMPLGVINHGMSFSVQMNFEKYTFQTGTSSYLFSSEKTLKYTT
jgi:hypothetical protein